MGALRIEKIMDKIYYDPSNAASFGGVRTLANAMKTRESDIRKWMSEQDAYTLHKPSRVHFPRRKTFSVCTDDLMAVRFSRLVFSCTTQ